MPEPRDRPDLCVNPEMKSAGAEELLSECGFSGEPRSLSYEALAEVVYRAMRRLEPCGE
jgi:hypothetical protein